MGFVLFMIRFNHCVAWKRLEKIENMVETKAKKEHGRDKQGGNKVETKKEYMEEMKLEHKPIEINNVIGLKVELCGSLRVKCKNRWI